MEAVLTRKDLLKLRRLRALFLQGTIETDYWTDDDLLDLYDRTFAKRIAWKWNVVLQEIQSCFFKASTVVDFGCGTAIASEVWCDTYPETHEIYLVDRSMRAAAFAKRKLSVKFPEKKILIARSLDECPRGGVVLLSHIINELKSDMLNQLTRKIKEFHGMIWVEPGAKEVSRLLLQVREKIRSEHFILAPCGYQSACGLQNTESQWCHHFAEIPNHVFHSQFWRRFAQELRIDLRALSYSFLVTSRSAHFQSSSDYFRVLGRVRESKSHIHLCLCGQGKVLMANLIKKRYSNLIKKRKKQSIPFFIPAWVFCD